MRATFHVVQGSAAGKVAAVLAGLLAAKYLGIDDFGAFTYALATAGLLTGIGQLAIPTLMTRDVAQTTDPATRGRILTSSVLVVLSATALVSVIGSIAVWMLSSDTTRAALPSWVFPVISTFAIATSLNTVLLAFLQGEQRFDGWRRLSLVRSLASSGLLLLALLVHPTPGVALLGMSVAEVCVAVVSSYVLRRSFSRPTAMFSRARAQMQVALGPASASMALIASGWIVQTVLIRQPNGTELVGAAGLAGRIGQAGFFIPAALLAALAPRLMARDKESAGFERRAERLALLTALAGAILTLATVPFLPLLGAAYAAAMVPTAVSAFGVITSTGNTVTGQLALGRQLNRAWWLSDWLLALAGLSLGILLIPHLQATAPALAGVCAGGLSWAALRLYIVRWERQPSATR